MARSSGMVPVSHGDRPLEAAAAAEAAETGRLDE